MIFQSRSVGIDLRPDSIRIAVAVSQGGRTKILDLLERELPEPVEGEAADPTGTVDKALGDMLKEIGASDDVWVACLPAAASINRLLNTPLTDSAKIKQTLKFQIEPQIPYPVDQVISDFTSARKLDEGSEILAVAVTKESVSERLRPLRSAGIDPHILTLDALALADFYITPFDFSDDRITALLLLTDAASPFLGFFAGEKLVGYRSLEGVDPDDDASIAGMIKELRRSLVGFKPSAGENGEIGALCVGGRGGETIKEYLAEEFRDFPVRYVEFNERTLAEIPPDLPGSVDDFKLAIALARAGLEAPANAVNFMQEEYAPASVLSRLLPSIKFSLVVLGVVFLAWFAGVRAQIHGQTRRLEALKGEMVNILAETMPGARSSSAIEQMIAQKQSEFSSLKNYSTEYVSPLDVLREVDAVVSENTRLTLIVLDISDNALRMTGIVDSYDDTNVVKKQIESSPLFSEVDFSGTTHQSGDKISFQIRARIGGKASSDAHKGGGGES